MARSKAKTKERKQDAPTPLRAEPGPRAAATPSRAESGPQPASTPAPALQGQMPLLYKRPRPLHLTEDADLTLRSPINYSFVADVVAVPMVLGEFLVAGRDYPIVFGPGNPPAPVIFMGVNRNENLFVGKDGSWAPGVYVPAYIRRCPFLLIEGGEPRRRVLFVDEESPNIARGEGAPLVADGKPTEVAQAALKFCEAFAYDQEQTRQFCQAVVAQDLLETRDIKIAIPGGKTLVLKDIRVISPRKFEEMSDAQYLEWRKRKWLFPAFAHIQSAINWQRLAERAAGQTS